MLFEDRSITTSLIMIGINGDTAKIIPLVYNASPSYVPRQDDSPRIGRRTWPL